ncbi:NDP-hexose 2,3-dehydratase family protein [Dietzia psychralcaliphila]|nr:NDP-hexose 2,3-dehydratase family protein [Dietzia psychralcaliphila]
MSPTGSRRMPGFETVDEVLGWLDVQRERMTMTARPVPLEDLRNWHLDPVSGNLGHESGKFFSVEGVRVTDPAGPVPAWDQPIIHQPEVGILGILADRSRIGPTRFLMQAKFEPGNPGGVQLSPTVQATRSNYLRVHGGRPVPYLEHFRDVDPESVLADVRQSEQGAWFFRKRNRNMIVESRDAIEPREGFCWVGLPLLLQLLHVPDLLNMDARTVLACAPPEALAGVETVGGGARSGSLSWITDQRTGTELTAELIPLNETARWRLDDGMIRHDSGGHFTILGVEVTATGREVSSWHQPMLAPTGPGIVGALVTREGGTVSVLMRSRTEPGCTDGVELGPTVQCQPDTLERHPERLAPPFLDRFLSPEPGSVRFDVVQSEEGGRFYFARNRYMVVEIDGRLSAPAGFRWFGLDEISDFMRHSFYLNVQARSIALCLTSLVAAHA